MIQVWSIISLHNIGIPTKTVKEIIKQIKLEYPYDNIMCRDKYNETIQDYLYEEIISKL